jgi:hypothetical protein
MTRQKSATPEAQFEWSKLLAALQLKRIRLRLNGKGERLPVMMNGKT